MLPAKLLQAGIQCQWGRMGMLRSWRTRQMTFCTEAEEGAVGLPRTFPMRRFLPAASARAPVCEHQAKGCTRTKSWGLGI